MHFWWGGGAGEGREDLGAGAGETSLVSLAGQLLVAVRLFSCQVAFATQ